MECGHTACTYMRLKRCSSTPVERCGGAVISGVLLFFVSELYNETRELSHRPDGILVDICGMPELTQMLIYASYLNRLIRRPGIMPKSNFGIRHT
jgi:hypothetical protein